MRLKDGGCPLQPFRTSGGMEVRIHPHKPVYLSVWGEHSRIAVAVPIALSVKADTYIAGCRFFVSGSSAEFTLATDTGEVSQMYSFMSPDRIPTCWLFQLLPVGTKFSGYLMFEGRGRMPPFALESRCMGELWLGANEEDVYGLPVVLCERLTSNEFQDFCATVRDSLSM